MPRINADYRARCRSRRLILAIGPARAQRPGPVSVSTVVVVKNLNNADSVAIADYYQRKRKLPAENICTVRCTEGEECSYKEYDEQLKRPLKQFLARLNRPIDYIVLTKGIPIRTHEGNTSYLVSFATHCVGTRRSYATRYTGTRHQRFVGSCDFSVSPWR